MAHLVVEAGKEKGTRIPLPADGVVTFGRDTGCGHQVMDLSASRVHFRIHASGGTIRLEDLDSRNGTYVNEERVKAVELSAGDEVRVGDTIFTYHDGAPPAAEPVPIDPKSVPKPFDPLVGKNVGGYHIHEMIGRGGMGTVYKANQVSLNRTVALKILSRRYTSDEKFTDMFVREARAAGALNHPNIVQVYDVGREEDLHYFSMEHMARGTVGDMLKELGTVSVPRAIAMILHAAKGLEYADRKGLIHCDIKPDNLMLTEEGTVKIVDLGLSRTTMGDKEEEGDVAFGTPHFVAPEQAQRKKIDHRADLYSLGASFFLMITGYPVFLGDSAREIVMKHIKEAPPKAGEINTAIPDSVSGIIDRLLKKSPDDRFTNATALLEDLKRANIEINPQAAYTDGFPGMPAQEKSKPTGLIALGAGVLVILLAAIFILPGLFGGDDEGNGENPGEQGTPTADSKSGEETEAERLAREEMEREQKKLDERKQQLDERDRQARETDAFKDLKAVSEFEKKHGLKGHLSPAVLKKYEALARKYPKTEAGKIAARKAKEYRKAQEEYRGKQKEASDLFKRLLNKMRALVKEQKFGKALAVLDTFPEKKYEETDAADQLPNAIRIVNVRAADDWVTGLTNAQSMEGKGNIAGARAFFDNVVTDWGLEPYVTKARTELKRLLKAAATQAERDARARVEADEKRLKAAATEAEKAAGEYRYPDAIDIIRQILPGAPKPIATADVRARAKGLERDYQHLVALMNRMIASAEKKKGRVKIRRRGRDAIVLGATREFLLVNMGGAQTQVAWTKFSKVEFFNAASKLLDPETAEDHLRLGVFAMVHGLGRHVEKKLDLAKKGGNAKIAREAVLYEKRFHAGAGKAGQQREEQAREMYAEIVDLFKSAEEEEDHGKAAKLLQKALEMFDEWVKDYGTTKFVRDKK